ncbi:hypothetical protein ONE63_011389 [Megalurothrips usitatus]|uniref:Reverse transcriptase Ty1/copia-type domain-containing protein n=1 Tax=Megalurothrips usitatus TaxID=439358 RepID=A0AAV7WZG4_9NEOP|nr:hypothetical protein ONE63_011389 [Megalurothrips usitatus]
MEQPEGFVSKGNAGKVCKLTKAIYGLRQASRVWYENVCATMAELGYEKSMIEPCIFFKRSGDDITVVALYVDDFFFFGRLQVELSRIKEALAERFSVKDLGEATECLGMRVSRVKNGFKLDQRRYAEEVLRRFDMDQAYPVSTPLDNAVTPPAANSDPVDQKKYQELVGSLMYLAICTRPDLAFPVSYLSQFNSCPSKESWCQARRTLKYLCGSVNHSLMFQQTGRELAAYTDADHYNLTGKSYTGFLFTLAGGPVVWEAKKQRHSTRSSAGSEYIAISDTSAELMAVRNFLRELHPDFCPEQVTLYNDSKSAQAMVLHDTKRSRHIHVHYHYVRQFIDEGSLKAIGLMMAD